MVELKIDPEFQDLISPLSEDEYKQLEENILNAGECYDPIVVWNGFIVDGHNRWKIIHDHPDESIIYTTKEIVLFSRNDALVWIIQNQLGRRNLNKADAILLAKRKAEITAEEAKAKQRAAGGDKRSAEYKETASVQMDKSDLKPIDTRKEIAKTAGVSTGTVARFEEVQKKKPELVDKIRSGEITIGGAYREVKESEKQETQEVKHDQPITGEQSCSAMPKTMKGDFDNDTNSMTSEKHDDGNIFNVEILTSFIDDFFDEQYSYLKRYIAEKNKYYQTQQDRKKVKKAVSKGIEKFHELEGLLN